MLLGKEIGNRDKAIYPICLKKQKFLLKRRKERSLRRLNGRK
jgi:hypothetical protein